MSALNTFVICPQCLRQLWGKDKKNCNSKLEAHLMYGCEGKKHSDFVKEHDKPIYGFCHICDTEREVIKEDNRNEWIFRCSICGDRIAWKPKEW